MTDLSVAIVGMAGRFAGAPDLAEYWRIIAEGVTTVRRLNPDELARGGEQLDRAGDPDYVPYYAPMDDAAWFDADFFGFSPLDATITDPQQRVFLECCWLAMASAGHPPHPEAALPVIGLYAGCGHNRYRSLVEAQRHNLPHIDDYRILIGTGPDHLCLRVAHQLGLTGPCMTVLTACSSSLVAVHQACQGLLAGDCDLALAGGAAIRTPPRGYLARPGNGLLSPTGQCRTFDAAADGTVGGDGAGVVVLKRLADALADGDQIYATILGSAVNNDGRDRVGYTAPGVAGQAAVISAAQTAAEVDPATIGYVEAHGSATPMGDPIEVAALARAFGSAAGSDSCVLGAVKPNVGHTDAAAGVAGLLKVVLALQNQVLPPSTHLREPNPDLELAKTPFQLITEARPWPAGAYPRRAGVNSFGLGGANAHVVVEESPVSRPPLPAPPAPFQRERYLIPITPPGASAVTATAADRPAAESLAADRPAADRPAGDSPEPPPRPAAEVSADQEVVETVSLFYCEVLGVPEAPAHADFFRLGGDSLIAMQLIARLHETYGVLVPPVAVFAERTPAGVAGVISELLAGVEVQEIIDRAEARADEQ